MLRCGNAFPWEPVDKYGSKEGPWWHELLRCCRRAFKDGNFCVKVLTCILAVLLTGQTGDPQEIFI